MHVTERAPPLPRLPMLLLRALLPRAERDEIVADVTAEYLSIAARHGRRTAADWLWRQSLGSVSPLLNWTSWRSRTGWQPHANAFRPGTPMIRTLIADASYAARRLRARPGYTLLAVLTLALGIGGTAAVFGIARPVMFDPLPFANTSEVGTFWMGGWWTEEEYLYMRDKFSGFRDVAAQRPGDITLRENDGPARLIPGLQTSANFFDVLGAKPLLGRAFQKGDDTQGAEPTVVIGYGLWQELGGDRSIVGKRLMLDGAERTVVGVMPRGFWYPNPSVRMWIVKPLDPQGRNGSYNLLGRVAPGLDVHNMGPSINRITAALHERFQYGEEDDKTKKAFVTPLRDELLGGMRPALLATLAAMGLILLIACTNVAALMLGQVEGRATELSVRAALGATRTRLTQQLVVEALLLGLGAGLVGGAVAAGGFRLMARALPIGAWAESAAFDWTLFAVALLIALVAVLLVVLIPLASLWRGDLRGALSRARTGGLQGRGGKMERGLVVAEVALAMLIASGAALLVRSVANLYAIDAGVHTDGLAVIDVLTSRDMKAAERRPKIEELTAALGALPGVQSAVATMKLPLRGGGDSFNIEIEGRGLPVGSFTYFRFVTPGWFETLGIKLRRGRLIEPTDRAGAERVVVINEALAKKYFPGEDPIGKRMGGGLSGFVRIVGIVADVAEGKLTDEAAPVRYYPAGQVPWFGNNVTFVVRTTRPGDAVPILESARKTVQRVTPQFAVQGTTTMSRVLDTAVGPARQIMTLLGLLAGLALILGAIGIYGVISHFAARRQRDWAIRVALGLPGSHVVRHVVGQGVGLALVGIVFGAIGAVALARMLSTFLFGVGTLDVLSFAAASTALLAIGAVAAFIPARRAGTVDPALVLREQ